MLQHDPRKDYLDTLVAQFEQPGFIGTDPIAIPHGFDDPRDQEVIGLYAAILAWGRREIIIKKMEELCERMRYRPFEFVRSFSDRDAARLEGFKHRTFQPVDALWFTKALHLALKSAGTVENLFVKHLSEDSENVGPAVQGFSETIMQTLPGIPNRLNKHLARPSTGSACKRLVMYLRWMVRPGPVDLGIWSMIPKDRLVLPLDIHSGRTARALGLLTRPANDWRAALELTENCKQLCPDDPCRYDFAFFAPGAYGVSLDTRFVGMTNVDLSSSPTDR